MTSKKAAAVSNDILDDWKNIKEQTLKTTDALAEAATNLKERAEEAFQDSFSSLREKSNQLPENIVKYVKKNPLKALGFAALAGLFISKII